MNPRTLDWTLAEFEDQLGKIPLLIVDLKVQRKASHPFLYNAMVLFEDGTSVSVYGYETICKALGALMDRCAGIACSHD